MVGLKRKIRIRQTRTLKRPRKILTAVRSSTLSRSPLHSSIQLSSIQLNSIQLSNIQRSSIRRSNIRSIQPNNIRNNRIRRSSRVSQFRLSSLCRRELISSFV